MISFVSDIEDIGDDQAEQQEAAPAIDALFSECYYFQLSSQPVWQAVSFYYLTRSLRPRLAPDAAVLPARARLMCAAVELPDLRSSHGLVGRWGGAGP